jgi:cytoskeleton protein RodZ
MSETSGQHTAVQAPAAPPAPELPSPGRLLRSARERAGLGAEDLAGQLKLAKGTLEALERDDFAALSEPVYIRGYYRKIAKLLPVSETELIEAYTAHTTGVRTKPAPAAAAMRRIPLAGGVAAGTSRQYRGQGVWIIVGVVVAAVVLFVLAERQVPERLKLEEPKDQPAATAAVPPQAAPMATPGPTPAPAPVTTAPQAKAPVATAPAPAAMPVPAPSTTVVPSPPAGTATQPPVPANVPAVAPTQLMLDFSESSFVRVEDGRGKTLAIGLVKGGERQTLNGEPPYTLFLGNAQNVKVFYGGRPVDFSPHVNRQNDTARFTVP